MSTLIPRLWPFLSHSTSSVRKSTLVTLKTLTKNTLNEKSSGDASEAAVKVVDTPAHPAAVTDMNLSFDSKSLRLNFGVVDWTSALLQEALRHVFQRILVEPLADIQEMAKEVWLNLIANANLGALLHAACPFVSSWICLAMQPPRLAFDASILIHAASHGEEGTSSDAVTTPHRSRRNHRLADDLGGSNATASLKLYLGGSESTPLEVRERNYVRARITAARVLGSLSHYLVQPAPGVVYSPETESPMDCYAKVLLGHLNSRSAVQRLVCSLIIAFWAKNDPSVCPGTAKLQEKLRYCVMEYVYFDEVAVSLTRYCCDIVFYFF